MWIAGEIITVSRTDTASAAVSVSAPQLTAARPDGTVQQLSVAVTGSQPGTQHTLSALLPVTMAGKWHLLWSYNTSDGQTLLETETHFAGYTDMGALVRRRLNESTATLADTDLDPELEFTVRTLIDRFTALQQAGGYGGLTGQDQERFDQAAGLLTAVRMYQYRTKPVPTAQVQQVKMGQNAFVFGAAKQTTGELTSAWKQEALLALGRVSLVQQQFAAAAASFKPFQASGPTRYQKSQGGIETLMGGVIRLLTDDWYLTDAYINGDIGLWLG